MLASRMKRPYSSDCLRRKAANATPHSPAGLDALRKELAADLGAIHGGGEPVCKLADASLWRGFRGKQTIPEVEVQFLMAELGDRRDLRKPLHPRAGRRCQRPQAAGPQLSRRRRIIHDRCG